MATVQNEYLRNAILTASPEQLLLMLYDGAIRYTRQGVEGLEARDWEQAFTGFSRAQKVVLELINSLNYEVDRDLCTKMAGLYNFVYRQLVEACSERSVTAATEAIQILEYQRETWVLLIEQLRYNFLYRWFVGMSGTEAPWDASTYAKNRDRFLGGDVAAAFFDKVLAQAQAAGLTSDEHFSVDGTLIEAWASHKSFKPKDGDDSKPPDDPGNPSVDFRGQKRSNKTHQSTTDPDARLYKKSKGDAARMSYHGHILMENRHGFVVNAKATLSTGKAERQGTIRASSSLPCGCST